MKILAFSDLHLSLSGLDAIKKKIEDSKPDYLVCAGDISIFEENLDWVLDKIAAFKKPSLFIHGNHESAEGMKAAVEKHDGFTFLHKKAVEVDDVLFIGFGGGGFSQIEPDFERWTPSLRERIHEHGKVVLVTHGPPHKTALDELYPGEHVGVKSYRSFISQNSKPLKWAISGHIHETQGKMDVIGTTKLLNPGGKGKVIVI